MIKRKSILCNATKIKKKLFAPCGRATLPSCCRLGAIARVARHKYIRLARVVA